LNRNKLMETVQTTYRQCQEKYQKTLEGSDQPLIYQLKNKSIRETNVKDTDVSFSPSSLDTRNLTEYSVEDSDLSKTTDHNGVLSPVHRQQPSSSNSNNSTFDESHSKRNGQSHHLPQIKESDEFNGTPTSVTANGTRAKQRFRESIGGHLTSPGIDTRNDSGSSSSHSPLHNVEIVLNGCGAISNQTEGTPDTIEDAIINELNGNHPLPPPPSAMITPQQSAAEDYCDPRRPRSDSIHSASSMRSDTMESMSVSTRNGYAPVVGLPHALSKRNHPHKGKRRKHRREQIRELRELVASLQQQLTMKDERISDLMQSNSTVRQTSKLKDQAIERLKEEVTVLKTKLSSVNHLRAKSISNVMRTPRVQRSSSFTIGADGKVRRMVKLPEDLIYGKSESVQSLRAPVVGPKIHRSASERVANVNGFASNHRKTKSNHLSEKFNAYTLPSG